MLKRSLVYASIVLGLVTAGTLFNAQAEEQEKEFQATCPVSGRAAIEDSHVKFEGKKVYFCCTNCPKRFQANTEAYAAKAHHQMAETGQIAQVACPLTGRPLNPKTQIDVEGVAVSFCCNNCKGKAEKSDDQVALIFTNLEKGFTPQTACPVSGKPINAEHSVTYEGKKVYFCCPNCPKAFEANPDKYKDKLPQLKEKEEDTDA